MESLHARAGRHGEGPAPAGLSKNQALKRWENPRRIDYTQSKKLRFHSKGLKAGKPRNSALSLPSTMINSQKVAKD
jgi:hypothetical protein